MQFIYNLLFIVGFLVKYELFFIIFSSNIYLNIFHIFHRMLQIIVMYVYYLINILFSLLVYQIIEIYIYLIFIEAFIFYWIFLLNQLFVMEFLQTVTNILLSQIHPCQYLLEYNDFIILFYDNLHLIIFTFVLWKNHTLLMFFITIITLKAIFVISMPQRMLLYKFMAKVYV